MNRIKMLLGILVVLIIISLSSCAYQTCPTYARATPAYLRPGYNPVKPITARGYLRQEVKEATRSRR